MFRKIIQFCTNMFQEGLLFLQRLTFGTGLVGGLLFLERLTYGIDLVEN